MRDRDLALAEALAGENPLSASEPPVRRFGRVTKEADKLRSLLKEEAKRRDILERSAVIWQQKSQRPEEWRSFINLIRARRGPHAGVVLPNVESAPTEDDLVDAVTWYRDQLLSLHPAYLATREPLFERVTQLITLTIRMEQSGEIPNRR